MATQPFPHRLFKATEMDSTLVDLGLSLGGSLVVKKTDPSQLSSTSGKHSVAVDFLGGFARQCLVISFKKSLHYTRL